MPAVYAYFPAVGCLSLQEEDGAVTAVSFGRLPEALPAPQTPLLQQALCLLTRYFEGDNPAFNLPLRLRGTPFQLAVWQALREIPYGETRSYQEIAQAAGAPKACRGVGGACNRNPLAIFVPCHRVIGKNGALTGFGGGLSVKEALLRLERPPASS